MIQPKVDIFYHSTKQVNYKGMALTIPSVINYLGIEQDGMIYGFTVEPDPDPDGFFFTEDRTNLIFPIGQFDSHIENWDTTLEEV